MTVATVSVAQLTLPEAEAWEPEWPANPGAVALGRTFLAAGVQQRPVPNTTEDRQFRRNVLRLRELGWPIVAEYDGTYRLTFEAWAIEALRDDLERLGKKHLHTASRVGAILSKRVA